MHAQAHLALERVDRFLGEYLPSAVVADTRPLAVGAWAVPESTPGPHLRLMDVLTAAEFTEIAPGERWGVPWTTTWFHVRGRVPRDWGSTGTRVELSIDLGFGQAKPGFQCEGLVRTPDGRAVKGLEPRNHHVPLDVTAGDSFEFYVEAAANPDLTGGNDFNGPLAFAPNPLGDPLTAPTSPAYQLGRCELRLIDIGAEELLREVTVLRGLAVELSETQPRRAEIVCGLEAALYRLDPDAPGLGIAAARARLRPLLAKPAAASAHRIVATGHAHIDSAWLWPTRETVRKVTRTFANVLDLMDHSDVTFAASSAQHYAWVRDHDPEVYERVKHRVAQGRFLPVGNMWVESDVNMPSGESLARQLLYGTRFFEDEFGQRSDVGWLPDSFGYPAALPQLLRKAGLRWFFTQKMCWNDVDTMPHHSFRWEGLDGTRIFTHFPPDNTYSGDMRPTELARAVRNFADHGVATTSLMPFGYGDGGGGPTREMLADARLQSDLEGSPRLRIGTPTEFFVDAEDEYRDPPVWTGEMYLEFHRGIYTSQSRTKRGNRRNEALLVEAELWCTVATIQAGAQYPYEELDELWRDVLTLQFHDILPGSSIAWVHREAEATHERVTGRLRELIDTALATVSGVGTARVVANPSPFAVQGIPAFGLGVPEPTTQAEARQDHDGFRLSSAELTVHVGTNGTVHSIVDRHTGRELVAPGKVANLLQMHTDAPARFDAWDLDRSYRLATTDLVNGTATLADDGSINVEITVGASTIEQSITLNDGAVQIHTRVDWHERHRLIKLAFPLDLHAHDAAYETQFGHVRRPLHTNTSWDAARYEVCAHRWVHVGEPGCGVAIVNDGMYGHDITRDSDEGRVTTTVRQSLLRAPTYPDPEADQGMHEFVTVIAPAPTTDDAARWGAVVGSPPRAVIGVGPVSPVITVDEGSSAVLSAVKLAADRSGDVIVRIYEHRGARTTATLRPNFAFVDARECELVETPASWAPGALRSVSADAIVVELRPFDVVTLRITLSPEGEHDGSR